MRNVSELVGVVVDGNPVRYQEINNEQFYYITVKFRNTKIRVLYSTYSCNERFAEGTKIEVVGTLMSFTRRKTFPDFFFYANRIERADPDAMSTNSIEFECKISKVKPLAVGVQSADTLPLIGNNRSPLNKTSTIYLYIRDGDARRLQNKEAGYIIRGKGYMKNYKDVIEILVTDVENMDNLCPNKQKEENI